jgi:hypothetical protein
LRLTRLVGVVYLSLAVTVVCYFLPWYRMVFTLGAEEAVWTQSGFERDVGGHATEYEKLNRNLNPGIAWSSRWSPWLSPFVTFGYLVAAATVSSFVPRRWAMTLAGALSLVALAFAFVTGPKVGQAPWMVGMIDIQRTVWMWLTYGALAAVVVSSWSIRRKSRSQDDARLSWRPGAGRAGKRAPATAPARSDSELASSPHVRPGQSEDVSPPTGP